MVMMIVYYVVLGVLILLRRGKADTIPNLLFNSRHSVHIRRLARALYTMKNYVQPP
jgi:hypothetical protein